MKVVISFEVPDDFNVGPAVMEIENALPDEADNFEWDTE